LLLPCQDDAGIPKDYRHMPGFGVHTWKLVNKEGRETFVKFHFKTRQGGQGKGHFPLLVKGGVGVGGLGVGWGKVYCCSMHALA
jgi:hypothetical protein